ncbi:MAG: tRNA (adenosine(37)-N6)-threonylcarbamoyltransferase complex ATPase subunit type 1 TsaE [Candidatus Nitrospinota bacterium M3_3B_026]
MSGFADTMGEDSRLKTIIATTRSPGETESLGERIGEALGGGDVVALEGGLGAGKTVLARGMLRGLGVGEKTPVRSPTFTLVSEYQGRIGARHADLYRVEGPEDLETIGLFDEQTAGVTIIEWADRLPREDREKAVVMIRITDIRGTERKLSIRGPERVLAGIGPEVRL